MNAVEVSRIGSIDGRLHLTGQGLSSHAYYLPLATTESIMMGRTVQLAESGVEFVEIEVVVMVRVVVDQHIQQRALVRQLRQMFLLESLGMTNKWKNRKRKNRIHQFLFFNCEESKHLMARGKQSSIQNNDGNYQVIYASLDIHLFIHLYCNGINHYCLHQLMRCLKVVASSKQLCWISIFIGLLVLIIKLLIGWICDWRAEFKPKK